MSIRRHAREDQVQVRRVPVKHVAGAVNVAVVTGATAHTMGAWSQVFASTPADADFLSLYSSIGGNGNNSSMLIEVAVGAAGAETTVISPVAIGGIGADLVFPISIPAGSRVAMRAQGAQLSRSVPWAARLERRFDFAPPATLDVFGVDTTTSLGTNLVSTGWSELVASTAKAYRTMFFIPSVTPVQNYQGFLQLGVGPAGAEVSQETPMWVKGSNTETIWMSSGDYPLWWDCWSDPVPVGSRVAAFRTGGAYSCVTLIGVPF